MRLLGVGLISLAICGSTASARPAADDLSTLVFLSQGAGITQVQGPTFGLVVEVEGSTGIPRAVSIRTALPGGLTFETAPSPDDNCSGSITERDTPLDCTKAMALDGAGTARASWRWNLRASSPGTYTVSVTASSAEADPNPQNNANTLQFQVTAGAGGGGAGGGSTAAQAGPVRVAPAEPRAGARVSASVRVTAAGSPVRPTRVACAATVAGVKAAATARAASGFAICSFTTSARSRGKTLRGSVRITARGATLIRRFSVRLA